MFEAIFGDNLDRLKEKISRKVIDIKTGIGSSEIRKEKEIRKLR